MKETEILRGLSKARSGLRAGGKYAGGFVPSQEAVDQFSRGAGSMRRISQGQQTAKDLPFAVIDAGVGVLRQPLSAMYNGAKSAITRTPPPAAPVANPADIAPPVLAPALEGLRKRHEDMKNLSRGTAFLEGPGTGTSDDVPVNLSRGEAVLPAKTVRKLGPENIARIIQDTNDGKAPKGLRAGGSYNTGLLEKAVGGLSADDLDMKKVQPAANMPPKPAAAPAAVTATAEALNRPTGAGSTYRAGTGGERIATAADEAAALARQTATASTSTPGVTPKPAAPEGLWAKTKFYAGQGTGKVADSLPGKDTAGKVAAGLGTAVEGGLAVRDMATDGMDGFDRAGRGVEAANRVSGGTLGASLGATLGSVVPVVGTAVGGLAGGYLGATYGPQLAQKLSNWTNGRDDVLPSEKAAGLRAKQLATQLAAPTPAAQPKPAPAAQPQATQPVAIQQPAPHPQAAGPHPDLTGQLNAMPSDLNSVKGLQQGTIYKTMGANGNPVYSGMNVGANAQFADGQGNSVTPRGGVHSGIYGEGGTVVDGNAGLRAARGYGGPSGGADVSAALQAAAARGDWDAVQQHYQRNGGTWQGTTAAQDSEAAAQSDAARARQTLMGDIQRGLAGGGRLTRSGMAALQGVVNNEASREASQATLLSANYRHDTPSGDARLNAQIEGSKAVQSAAANRAKAEQEARTQGNDDLHKRLAMDPAAQGATPEEAKQRHARLVDHLSRTNRTVTIGNEKVDLATAFRKDPRAAEQAVAEESGTLSLSDLARANGENFWFTNVPKAGEIELAEPMGDVNMADYKNGMKVGPMVWEKAFGSGVVRIKGANNKVVSIPLSKITDDPNSASIFQALASANKRFADSQKK